MTPWLLEFSVNNVILSAAIAVVAYAVHRYGKLPVVAHLLWVLVLVKLVTPPVVTIPMLAIPQFGASGSETAVPLTGVELTAAQISELELASETSWWSAYGAPALLLCWALGSLVVLARSLCRVVHFSRLLRAAALPVPDKVVRQTARLAKQLGIKRPPKLLATSAAVSPLIWWVGGRVKLVLPAVLLSELTREELRWALAHELGHVRRRDYLVRWLEWLTCVTFWWNPIAWWARRNLRANEEICCDALVLRTLRPRPKAYGNALLAVVEFLSSPVIRPPAVASELNSGGFLERRFQMIMSNKRPTLTPRWLTTGLLLATFCLLPLGVAYGQDYDAVQRRLGKAVGEGEITLQQANAMMAALKKSAAATPAKKNISKTDLQRLADEIDAAVQAGKISKLQAQEKLQGLKKLAAVQNVKAVEPESEFEQTVRKIKAAVKANKITEEEARVKYEALLKKQAAENEAAVKKLKKIREDEAAAKKQAIQKEQAELKVSLENLEKRAKRIKAAVESGDISKEDAREKLEALRRAAAEKDKE